MPKSSSDESVNDAIKKLRSEDVLTQNEGVQELITIGQPAAAELLLLLDDKSAGTRAQSMYALSEIGTPKIAEAFKKGLRDEDERVRAYAATGLARIGDPDALAAAIQTLNDAPDEAHLDMTPSVSALGGMGLSAVGALLNLLMDDDENSRLHAQRALEMIIAGRHGFEVGKGFATSAAKENAEAEWRANGNYNYGAPAAARLAAEMKWRDWLRKQQL